jgi:hypothetical protein
MDDRSAHPYITAVRVKFDSGQRRRLASQIDLAPTFGKWPDFYIFS